MMNVNAAIPVLTVGAPGAPRGYEQITGLSTARGLTVPTGAIVAYIAIEGQAVRVRDDGTDPTASLGYPLAVGEKWLYTADLSALRIIEQTASATVNVLYY